MPRDELLLGRSEGNPSESPSSGIFFISHWFQFSKMQSQWHLLPCVSKVEQDVFGLTQKLGVQKCTWEVGVSIPSSGPGGPSHAVLAVSGPGLSVSLT